MMKLNKTDVVRKVGRQARVSQRLVGDVLDEMMRTVREVLREGHSITFPGFGTFYTSMRSGGKVKDFRTKQVRTFSARRVAAFRVGSILKRSVWASKSIRSGNEETWEVVECGSSAER
jgi:DNA-binding protein HU-beta